MIMHESILGDAQEVRRRLLTLGQDVDETVIYEILEGSGNYELDHIISMITEDWDSGYQDSSEVRTCIVDNKSEIQHCSEEASRTEDMHSTAEDVYIETSDVSTDCDDDRDDYYSSTNWDDISAIDTVIRSLPPPLELYDNTSSPTHDNEVILVPPEEFLEENNNDPNNNLDSVQMLQELQNNSLEVSFENKNSNIESCVKVEKPDSPKPGCSKDSHDTVVSHNDMKLHTDVEKISAVLPRVKRSLIYKTLCHYSNYSNAEDRIELTLWDLLSVNKSKLQISPKRKLSDNVYSMGGKKYFSRIPKYNVNAAYICSEESTASKSSLVKGTKNGICKMKRPITEEITISDGTDSDSNQENTVSISKAKLSKWERHDNDIIIDNVHDIKNPMEIDSRNEELQLTENPIILPKVEADTTTPASTSNTILRPPKLKIVPSNYGLMTPKVSSSMPTIILSKPKLQFVPNKTNDKQLLSRSLDIVQIQKNPSKIDGLKQNPDKQTSLNTFAGRKNKRISDVNTTQRHSSVNSVENTATILQNETLSNVEAEETELPRNYALHRLQLNSTKDKSIFIVSKQVQNMKSAAENNLTQIENSIDIPNLSQICNEGYEEMEIIPSTSTGIKAEIKQLGLSYSLQPFNDKQNHATQNIQATISSPHNSTSVHEKITLDLLDFANIQQDTIAEKKNEQKNIMDDSNDRKIILNQRALKIYYKLIPMFPNIDTTYIKQLCQNYINYKDNEVLDETVLLQDLIEELLVDGQHHPNNKKVELLTVSETVDVNEQYANLLGIFPEADPEYLRSIAEQMYNNPDQMKQFVQSKLEKPDYPTREQYLAKKKITEQQKQYTTGFQVQQFLEIFPDPFLHFENEKRKCNFNARAVDFLKHHFNKIRVHTLLNIYAKHEYNLSLTSKILETLNSDMVSKRIYPMVQTDNIPLLQECAFIQHKAEIQKYLAELKEKEQKEFNELKARNELIECQCCFDNECMPSKCSTCVDGHIFCNSCITKSTDVKLANGETHVICLSNCGSEFHLSVLQRILPPTKFSILLQKRQEAEVMAAGLEGLVSCPFCPFSSIPPQEDKVFKCLNPDCMKESCRLCKELNHLPLKCDEVKTDAARLYLEEKMTEALVRKCYRCGRAFFKEEGCNKMSCICGAQMCYICDKPVTNYNHFSGQGATRTDLCPLWSDDRRMNAEAVIEVCKKTIKHIKEKNPQVEINTDALLPKLPPKSRGPHEDIAHANVMPAHANRIARHIP